MRLVKQLIIEWLRGALIAYGLLSAIALVFAYFARRRPMIAAAWSAAIPGAGQWYAGARSRAAQFLVIDASLLLLGFIVFQDREAVIRAAVSQRALVFAMIGSLALLAFRAWSAYDAYILVSQEPVQGSNTQPVVAQPILIGALIGIGLLLATPHAVFGYYDVTHYNLLDVFAEDDVAAPVSTTSTTADPSTPPVTSDGIQPEPTTAAPPAPAIWDGLERLNILLLGADDGPNRRGIRTDTMIVVSIDPTDGNTAMISIPRNYARAPLPPGHGLWDCQCFPQLLNDLYYSGIQNPDAFPGPGTAEENAIKGGISEVLGIPIHYYAMVNLEGFVGIVDALGGVEIDVPSEIVEPSYAGPGLSGLVVIPPGEQLMDGYTALAYSRIRSQSSDYARMNRQRCVVKAVIDQSDPLELLAAYPSIAGVLRESMQTDIPLSRLPDFIDLLPKINTSEIVALSITPPEYLAGFTAQNQNIYDALLIREHVALILSGEPEAVSPDLGSGSLVSACS